MILKGQRPHDVDVFGKLIIQRVDFVVERWVETTIECRFYKTTFVARVEGWIHNGWFVSVMVYSLFLKDILNINGGDYIFVCGLVLQASLTQYQNW